LETELGEPIETGAFGYVPIHVTGSASFREIVAFFDRLAAAS